MSKELVVGHGASRALSAEEMRVALSDGVVKAMKPITKALQEAREEGARAERARLDPLLRQAVEALAQAKGAFMDIHADEELYLPASSLRAIGAIDAALEALRGAL